MVGFFDFFCNFAKKKKVETRKKTFEYCNEHNK